MTNNNNWICRTSATFPPICDSNVPYDSSFNEQWWESSVSGNGYGCAYETKPLESGNNCGGSYCGTMAIECYKSRTISLHDDGFFCKQY